MYKRLFSKNSSSDYIVDLGRAIEKEDEAKVESLLKKILVLRKLMPSMISFVGINI